MIIHAAVVISSEYTLHFFNYVIRGTCEGTPASGENRDQFDLIGGEVMDKLHGENFAQDCPREAHSGKRKVFFGNSDEMLPDNEAYVDNGGISQAGVFENKRTNKGEIYIRRSQLAMRS
jgi:hypothetical protein